MKAHWVFADMGKNNSNKLMKREALEKWIIIFASVILVYFIISLFFIRHFFLNTVINGANVSLKGRTTAENILRDYVKDYKLQLVMRNGDTEIISGQEIEIYYNEKINISEIYRQQNSVIWINSLFKTHKYYIKELFQFNQTSLCQAAEKLRCLNKDRVEPKDVSFKYSNGSYEIIKEEYGNKINKDKLVEAIKEGVTEGKKSLNLDKMQCYENPKYTAGSEKALKTRNELNKYVSAKITYHFGDKDEILDGRIISKWLKVNENLDVVINESAVREYIKYLSKKYDTVGALRQFTTYSGKSVEVEGGLYGWKLDRETEKKELIELITSGKVLDKEPVYSQRALSAKENDIGNTYIEVNITKQHLWFYKDGKLITHGAVVTGNPNRGNATVLGTYMIIYKQKDTSLTGPGYNAKVTYWMPFYGNMGLHDASWRHSFGGEIYKARGTHGCVNAPFSLAKKVFENIEEGIPIIIYEE